MKEAAEHDTVLDTGAEQLGKTYARALVGAAQSAGIADKIIDQLGREVNEVLGQMVFYIYDDGSAKKVFVVD